MAAKKTTTSSKPAIAKAPSKKTGVAKTTAVRNSAIPKAVSVPAAAAAVASVVAAPRQISFDQIAQRAYEIGNSGYGGSNDDNWFRAERELGGI